MNPYLHFLRPAIIIALSFVLSFDGIGQGQEVFKIQIGAFRQPVLTALFDLQDVSCDPQEDGLSHCQWGSFGTYQIALGQLEDLRRRGFSDAFIVKEIDGKREEVLPSDKELPLID